MTTTRALAATGLLFACSGSANAQVVFLSDVLPYWAPMPVIVAPPPEVHQPLPVAMPAAPASQGEVRQYPPAQQTQTQRPQSQRVVHERHYLKANQNASHYLAARPAPEYGPETTLVIREFFIDDEPAKKSESPPPVGSKDDGMRAVPNDRAPKNSTDARFPDEKSAPGVTPPNPAAADPNGRRSPPLDESNYPPTNEAYGPPAPPELLAASATTVVVASRGGTPMADMEVNFVDLAGTNADVKGRTDGKGEFKAKLAPSRWQAYLVFGDNERKSLGIILVKPTPGEPFRLQF